MPRRLTLVVHSLALGGAERFVAMLANYWAARGEAVTVITLDSAETDTYSLAPAVQRVGLALMGTSRTVFGALWNNVRRVRRLREAIRDSSPEIVISATEKMNIVALLACRPLHVPVVIAERTDPRRHRIGPLWSLLRYWTYPWSTALVVQTAGVKQHAGRYVRGRPIYVIPNAVDPTVLGCPADGSSVGETREKQIVALGRLSFEKGFDLLIDAFSRVAITHPDWTLEIVGEGPQRAELQELIDAKHLSDRIRLSGWTEQPGAVLRRSEIFVLPSRYEGFPNALLEAMACGAAVIAFDCDSGPAEIVRHDIDGLLVPAEDVAALAAALDRLLGDPDERRRLAERAAEVIDRFSPDRVFELWEAVLRGDTPE
jgi:GalNAc-alpha-(1->4)-GalNAc-alpha-(1->3)-diNAcBac-PP-undecaprenol alpha-1,4-N-acetyl-D-galactosaminyltransferase